MDKSRELADHLIAAGCNVNLSGNDWRRKRDFIPVIREMKLKAEHG